jgi:hypothetical protein
MTETNNTNMSLASMVELILSKGTPDSEQTFPPIVSSLTLQMPIKSAFDGLVEQVVDATCTHKSETYRKPNRELVRLILSNLVHAAFRFEQLTIPTKIRTDRYYHNLGFSQSRIEKIKGYLIDNDMMRLTRKGFRHPNNSKKSRGAQYYPSRRLLESFAEIIYSEYGDFNAYDPYEYKDESNRWDPNELESAEVLRKYNTMMSSHSWAMKSPAIRKLGSEPFTSGRVYTHYQNIVNRRIPIRSQTLLDGLPIVECDFSSNHPYLIAKLTGNEFDTDIYTMIGGKVGLDRKDVKRIITYGIGASSKDHGSIKYTLNDIGSLAIDKTLETAKEHFGWMNDALFNNLGIRLQWLEGEIAIRMFKDAVDLNMPMLCIHDAYGVNLKYQEITTKLMHQHREQVIQDNRQRWQQQEWQ